MALKVSRANALRPIPLTDKAGRPFEFSVPEIVMEELHHIDMGAGGLMGLPKAVTNAQARDRYVVNSLMEEAITSSQLEGAATTREVAREMIRSGRLPRDVSEQMIVNNYRTMQHIRQLTRSELTPQLVFEMHRLITEDTLDDVTAAGRVRRDDERLVVGDEFGQVFHDPPSAEELDARMDAMCAFANGKTPDYFVHPAVRAIILHFWLAYDHPFVDGNGRTARALFYWSMLRSGYGIFEFITISNILRKAPVKYGRSFLYTETDDNDLTYFLVAQTKVIREAIGELRAYIDRKTTIVHALELSLRALEFFNHRQRDLLRHALKNPGHRYTIASQKTSHGVAYQSARTDLLDLLNKGLLTKRMDGRTMVFVAPADLSERLKRMEENTDG